VVIEKHAAVGMACERPPIRENHILAVLEEPDHDDGHQAYKRVGPRTVIVYYEEDDDTVEVRSVSATRGRLEA
jgi:hypothetical protein